MTGPSWLSDVFAAAVIVIAVYAASRLVVSRLWQRQTELDADTVHVLMGVAMAGMFVPRLSSLRAGGWEVIFGAAAAWFAWQAIRGQRGTASGVPRWRCPHPVPHLVESAAMLYVFLAAPAAGADGLLRGTVSGMGGSSAVSARIPAVALALALFMVGYVVWTADRLTSLTPAAADGSARYEADRAGTATAACGAMAAASPRAPAGARGTFGEAGARHGQPAGRPVLAPRFAACYKIAVGITMAYMLILML